MEHNNCINSKLWAHQKRAKRSKRYKYINRKYAKIKLKSSTNYRSYQTEFEGFNNKTLKKIGTYFPNLTTKNIKQIIKNTKPKYVIKNSYYSDRFTLFYKHSLHHIYNYNQNATKIIFVHNKIPFKDEYEIYGDGIKLDVGYTAESILSDCNDLIIDLGKHIKLTSIGILLSKYNIKNAKQFKIYVSNKKLNTKEIRKFKKDNFWHKTFSYPIKKPKDMKIDKKQWIDMKWQYIGSFGKTIKHKIFNNINNNEQVQQIYDISNNYKQELCRYVKIQIVDWCIDESNWNKHIKLYGKWKHINTTVISNKLGATDWSRVNARYTNQIEFNVVNDPIYGDEDEYYWGEWPRITRARKKQIHLSTIDTCIQLHKDKTYGINTFTQIKAKKKATNKCHCCNGWVCKERFQAC
eukprot:186000_1